MSYLQSVMNYLPSVMNHLQTFASSAKYGNIVKRTYMLVLMGITGLLLFYIIIYYMVINSDISVCWLLDCQNRQ